MRRSRARIAYTGNTTQVTFTSRPSAGGPCVHEIPVWRMSATMLKRKKVKQSTQSDDIAPMASDLPELTNHESFHFIADVEPPTTKVCILHLLQVLCSQVSKTPQDYIQEWLLRKRMYIEALLANEVPDSFACHHCSVPGTWRC